MISRKVRYHLNKLLFPFLAFFLLLYVVYHLLSGNHGWFSWKTLETTLAEEQKTLELLEKEKTSLENKVNLLRPEHMDQDMLDERIRTMLNNVKEDEVLVIDKDLP
ncbi:MAG: septum formation initiator family protein [Alphaproteobacteria bacterium]